MKVSIVKYNAGNIFSVINAVKRLGIEPLLTDDKEELLTSDRVIFPGQGEASHAMEYLRARGLDEVIRNLRQPVLGICIGQQLLCRHSEEGDTDCIGVFPMDVKRFVPTRHEDKIPQMGWNELRFNVNGNGCQRPLAPSSLRGGVDYGNGCQRPLTPSSLRGGVDYGNGCQRPLAPSSLRGGVDYGKANGNVSPLFRGLSDGDFVYFVHSYYVPLHEEYTIAQTHFTLDYSAAIQKDNFFATQFHPEKSGRVGERILRNFMEVKSE